MTRYTCYISRAPRILRAAMASSEAAKRRRLEPVMPTPDLMMGGVRSSATRAMTREMEMMEMMEMDVMWM